MADTNKEDEKKEIKIFGCELCKISYNSEKDLKEHLWSLIHHAKIEDQKRNSAHTCSLCLSTCKTIPEYRKHLLDNRHKKAVEKFNIAEENGDAYVYSGSEEEEEKGDNQMNSVNRHQWWNPNNHPNYPPWNIPPWHRQNFKNFQQWGNVPERRYSDMNNVRKPGTGRYMGDNSDQHPMNFNNWRGRNDRNFRREKFDGNRHKKGKSKDEGFENPYWHNDDDWRSSYPPPLLMTPEDEQQWQNNEPYFNGYGQMPFQRNYGNFQGNINPDMYNNYMNFEYNQDSPEFYDDDNYSERNDPPPPHDDHNKDFGRQSRSGNQSSSSNQDNRPDEELDDRRQRYDRPRSRDPNRRSDPRLNDRRSSIEQDQSRDPKRRFDPRLNERRSSLEQDQSRDPNRRSDPRLNERRSSLEQDQSRDPNRRSDPRLNEKRSSIEQDPAGPKTLNIQAQGNKRQNEDEEPSPRTSAQKKMKTTIKGHNVSEQKKVTKTSASAKNSGKKNKPSPTKRKQENVNLRQGLRSRDKSKTPDHQKSKNNPPVASKRKARVAKSKAAFEITKSRDKIETGRSSVIADTRLNMDSETPFEKEAEICSQVQELLEDNLSSESVSYQAPIPNILACNVKKRTVQTISPRPTGGSFLSSIKFSEKRGKERSKVLLRSLLPDDIYSRPKKAKTFMKKKKSVKTSTVTSQSVLSEALVSSSSSITKSVVELVEDRSMVQESTKPSESMPSPETLNIERQFSSEPSTTCDDTSNNRLQTISVPPKAVSVPNRSAASETHRSPRRHSTSRDINPIILPNPSKVLKKPLTKEMLIKLVNSPRSRKERMQLANMLRNHAQSQNRLDSSRISHDDLDVSQVNQDLAGLCESLGGSQVPVVKIEDLTPEIQLQIAQLIETESEIGSIEQSLIDVINEGSKENKQQQLPSNVGDQQIIVNTTSSSAIVKAEPNDKTNKEETKEFSVQEMLVPCTPDADQSSRTRHTTQESTTSQNTTHSSPVTASTTNVPSSIPSTDSTPQQNFMSNPYSFPGAYPFGYMPPGFNPYQQMSMQFPNQFHPQFNPAFNMFQMRNPNQTPPLGPENMGSSSSSNVNPTQSDKGPMPPMNLFCPFPNFNPMTSPNCPPLRMGNPSAVSSVPKSFTSQALSPIAFDEAKVPKIDLQTQESSILKTVLQISMKEEDLQKELTELDTETGELYQVLQETFHKLKGCHDKKQKIEAKRVRLMERKMIVLKRCVGENVKGSQSPASRRPLTTDCSSEDDVTITATELCQDRISKIEPDTSVVSPLPSLVHRDSSGDLLTNSGDRSSQAETLNYQGYSSQNSSIFLNSPQTDSQTSVMAESTDSSESLDEVIVESDCSTEDETTGFIKVMDKFSDDKTMSVDVIKQESSEQISEMMVDESPKESPYPRVSVSVNESVIINLDSSYESQSENIVKAETVESSSSRNNSMLGSPTPCTTVIPNIERGLFVSPNSEHGFTVSPVKTVGYLRQRSASESDADARQSDAKSPSLAGRSVKYLGAFTGSPDSASLLKQLAANFSGVTSISQLPLTKSNDPSTNCHNELENSEVETERSLKKCSIVLEKLESDQPEEEAGQVDSSVSSELESNALSLSPVKDLHSKYHLDSSSDSTAEDSVPLANIKQRLKSQQYHVPNTPQFVSSSPVTALVSTPLSKDSSTSNLKHPEEGSPLSKDSSASHPQHPKEGSPLSKVSSTPNLKHTKEGSPLSKVSSTPNLKHPKEGSPLSKVSSTPNLKHTKEGSPLSKDSSASHPQHQKEGSPLSKDSSASHLQHQKEGSPLSKVSSTPNLKHTKEGSPLSKVSSTPNLKHTKEGSPLSKVSSTPNLKHTKEGSPLSKDSSASHLQHQKEGSPLSKDSITHNLKHPKQGYHPKSLEFESHQNPQKPETTSVPGQQHDQLQPDSIESQQPSTSLVTSSQSSGSTSQQPAQPESNLCPLNVNLGATLSETFLASRSTVSPESNLSLYPLNVKLGAAHSEMFPVEFSDDDSESEDSDLLEIGSGYEAYLESFETSTNASNDHSNSTKKSNKPFDGPRLTINGIQFDNDYVYVCYRGYGVRRFSKEEGELFVDYDTQDNTVNCMALATLPNGQSRLYLAGVAFYIMAYDVENSSLLYNIDVMEEVKCLHSDYGHVYGGLVNGMLEVISLQNNKKIDTYQSDDQCIHCITSAREGGFKLLCVSSQDATITIYDAFSGLPVRVLEGHSKTAFSVMVNMNKVYSGSGDKTVMVHDLHTGELEHVYREYKAMVTSVFIDRNYLYSASYDRLIRCYDVENQSLKCMYYGAGQRVVSSIVVHDRKLYTGNRDGETSIIPLDSKQVWPCQSDNCKHVFGIRDHLLYHLLNDHTVQNSFMTKCTWRGCKQWFYTQKDSQKFESHMEEHLEPVEF